MASAWWVRNEPKDPLTKREKASLNSVTFGFNTLAMNIYSLNVPATCSEDPMKVSGFINASALFVTYLRSADVPRGDQRPDAILDFEKLLTN